MNIKDADKPIYYVYAWYFKDNGEIFHIGKGKNDRYKDIKNHRNQFFLNVINKHKDNVDVKFLMTNLTNSESLENERKLIKYYKSISQCKTNLHEGGCGGYTGNYSSPERSRKLSESAKKRVGNKNPMFGRHHTPEARAKISVANIGRKLSPEHIEKLRGINTGRIKTPEERRKLSIANKGKIVFKHSIIKNIKTQIKYVYELTYNNIVFAVCLGAQQLSNFCEEQLSISRTILGKICNMTYIPKFNRHKWINNLKINTYEKDQYIHLNEYFKELAIVILDQSYFNMIKTIIKTEKDKADIIRYGMINPSIRK